MGTKEKEYNELKRIFIRASTVASIVNIGKDDLKTCEITMMNNDKHLIKGTAYEAYAKIDYMERESPNPLVGFDAF